MANEITVKPYMRLDNANLKLTISPGTSTYDQAAAGYYHNVSSIATGEESIGTFGDVATEGWCYIRNSDVANYVQIGFATGVYGMRLEAGETANFRCEPGLTLYLKSNTAATLVEILVLED
jgi:hypothetical protein